MTSTSAVILADSVAPNGVRLTSIEIVMHRFVLAEWNTPCTFARNSASSRAIPVKRTLEMYMNDPAFPISLPREQAGMSGGEELTRRDRTDAERLLHDVYEFTAHRVREYLDAHPDPTHRLHKSVVNRMMEWTQWHQVITTADQFAWAWFFKLRCSPHAQPEIRAAAEAVREAYRASTPRNIDYGEWHLPLVTDEQRQQYPNDAPWLSASRTARSSYMRQHDPEPIDATLDRGKSLAHNRHLSPFEHPATPDEHYPDACRSDHGKFRGWVQFRRQIEGDDYEAAYREYTISIESKG